jgi:methionyl-tRNA formyltransferase
MELAAICVPRKRSFASELARYLANRTILRVKSLFDRTLKYRYHLPLPVHLDYWARRLRFEVLSPPQGGINDQSFIAFLKEEVKPTIALSFYWLERFGPQLLKVFTHAVNYHNGMLPQYRGLRATSWSVYHNEEETGFTFHHMTCALDEGSILVQGSVPVAEAECLFDLEMEKTGKAVSYIPHVLQMIAEGYHGQSQKGTGKYYSENDYNAVTRVHDPSTLSSVELTRRLRAFELLHIRLGTTWYGVTKIRKVTKGLHKSLNLSFRTSDGVSMEMVRFWYLPQPLHRALNRRLRRYPGFAR